MRRSKSGFHELAKALAGGKQVAGVVRVLILLAQAVWPIGQHDGNQVEMLARFKMLEVLAGTKRRLFLKRHLSDDLHRLIVLSCYSNLGVQAVILNV